MGELVGQPGPTIDLGEQIRNVDIGQEAVELPLKRLGSFWNLTFQRRHDQRAVHEPYALELSGASAIGELLELKIERPPHRVEPYRRIARHAKVQAIGVLLFGEGARRHQIFVERTISAASLDPDVAGAQPIAKCAKRRNFVEGSIRLSAGEDQLLSGLIQK